MKRQLLVFLLVLEIFFFNLLFEAFVLENYNLFFDARKRALARDVNTSWCQKAKQDGAPVEYNNKLFHRAIVNIEIEGNMNFAEVRGAYVSFNKAGYEYPPSGPIPTIDQGLRTVLRSQFAEEGNYASYIYDDMGNRIVALWYANIEGGRTIFHITELWCTE